MKQGLEKIKHGKLYFKIHPETSIEIVEVYENGSPVEWSYDEEKGFVTIERAEIEPPFTLNIGLPKKTLMQKIKGFFNAR